MHTDFNLIFKDDPALGDWEMRLITDEPKTDEDIEKMIQSYAEQLAGGDISPNPVSIMDRLCEEHPGWRWEDSDYNAVVIENWK